eukprot:763448-Hanusia_phi.AAC.1
MKRKGVHCPACSEHVLERVDADEVSGWLCPNYSSYERGRGCHALVTQKEYQELLKESEPSDEATTAPSDQKKRKTETVAIPDETADPVSENAEMIENEDEAFDELPAQNVDVRLVSDCLQVRRQPACGLLSLNEVDHILKGAFVAPRGERSVGA